MRKTSWFLTAVTALILVAVNPARASVTAEPVSADLERAILASDWDRVAALTEKDSRPAGAGSKARTSAERRAIRGHALLATNHNDGSFSLFVGLDEANDLPAWKEWTESFSRRNPGSSVAFYLLGDAKARLHRWEEGLRAFDAALGADPGYSLALNARGVVLAILGRSGEAETTFEELGRLAPKFADAHASVGAFWLRRDIPRAAQEAFAQARAKSHEFALAANGAGCSKFAIGPTQMTGASKDFAAAARQLPLPLFLFNLETVAEAGIEVASKLRLQFSGEQIRDWAALRAKLSEPANPLHVEFAAVRPEALSPRKSVDLLNALLENPAFYDEHRSAIERALASPPKASPMRLIRGSISETEALRNNPASLSALEMARIRGLNRALVELLLPNLFRGLDPTESGMALMLNGGLVRDSFAHKQTLTSEQLIGGTSRMNYLYRPLADTMVGVSGAFQGRLGAILGAIGANWNRHLDNQLGQNNLILGQRGIETRQGGVTMEALARAFVAVKSKPRGTCFGLAYDVPGNDAGERR